MSNINDSKPTSPAVGPLVLILGLLSALGPLSIDMYLPAFPEIAKGLGVTVADVQASLASFFAGIASGQLIYGPAADRFGRKKPLYLGLTIYIVASVGCALATDVRLLVIGRFFQALGGCAGMVVTRAVIRDLFGPQESARIFSLLMLVMGAAPILAPLIGAQVTVHLGWRWIFWILVITPALILAAVWKKLPETRGPDPERRINEVFPVYWRILKHREFLLYALAGGSSQSAMFAYITGSPFVFISFFGISAENYGYVFGSNAMALILASQLNARLLRTRSFKNILDRSFAVLLTCATLLLAVSLYRPNLPFILILLFVFIGTLGLTFPNTTAGALAHEKKNAGSASALLGTLQFTLAGLASAAITQFHNGTAVPMAAVIFGCAIISFCCYWTLRLVSRQKGTA